MSVPPWAQVHGSSVHFPIALVLCSAALDGSAVILQGVAIRRGLQAASYWMMLLGALGTVPAVFSGLVMTHGVMLGHDALRYHHLCAWPAFALVVGAAAWRVRTGDFAEGRAPGGYLALVGLAAVLLMGAGYWGGEMMLGR